MRPFSLVYLLLALAFISPLAFFLSPEDRIPIAIAVGLLGWMAALYLFAMMFGARRQMGELLRKLNVSTTGDLPGDLNAALSEAVRYHRAAFEVYLKPKRGRREVPLEWLLNLAREELGARSVELSLFDESSGLWSKSFLIGEPLLPELQVMLSSVGESPPTVLSEPIRFADTVFGMIRVELEEDTKLSDSDLRVLRLLALQAALLLVDNRFTEELLRMRKVSDESIQAKTGFLANLSHEIRGPLGIIINGVELGLEGLCGTLSDEMKDTLRMIKDSGDHLLDLVNDVLDYAKVEAGKVTPKPAPIPLRSLLADLMNVIRTQAQAKEHKLILEPVESTLGVLCDRRHIRQIMINLLTNAVKYTPEKGTITVRAERHVGDRVKISVRDTGIGIPSDQRGKVFGAFERVEHRYAQAQVGTGLGMPLTAKLIEANGGSIDFESEEGRGSEFWVILPGATPAGGVETVEDVERKSEFVAAVGRGESVLVVEPDTEARVMVERYLHHQGFLVLRATSGKEILRVLRDQQVDLCIVENDLPDLSGEEVVSVIRAHPRASTVPLILLSARAFVFDIERFLKMGVDRCLTKPFDLGDLALTARQLLDETGPNVEPQA